MKSVQPSNPSCSSRSRSGSAVLVWNTSVAELPWIRPPTFTGVGRQLRTGEGVDAIDQTGGDWRASGSAVSIAAPRRIHGVSTDGFGSG
jgi:hypothetical protein